MSSARLQVQWDAYLRRVRNAIDGELEDPGREARAVIGEGLRLSDDQRLRELAQARREGDRHREWLEAVNASASWRMTAPLRAAKRRLNR